VVHWTGATRKKYIVDARQMREEQQSAKFRHALCGSRCDPGDIVDDPRLVTCERCLKLLSTTRVQWHNRLLAKAKEGV
jgi:hypothetical protein